MPSDQECDQRRNEKMIIAVDVHYKASAAKAVSIEFPDWEDEVPWKINIVKIEGYTDYIPGEFYMRELPCIMCVLEKSDLKQAEAIIIDGYVILDDQGKPGLGGYLFQELNKKIPVIGVAKTCFTGNKRHVVKVYRGNSGNPLFITSLGMELREAADLVRRMKGNFRIPLLLRKLDRETKI
jgi:deoxyribonuclease V